MKRHPVDPVSLVFGLAFLALAGASLIADPVELVEARWLWPSLLVVLGLALLLAPLGSSGQADRLSAEADGTSHVPTDDVNGDDR